MGDTAIEGARGCSVGGLEADSLTGVNHTEEPAVCLRQVCWTYWFDIERQALCRFLAPHFPAPNFPGVCSTTNPPPSSRLPG